MLSAIRCSEDLLMFVEPHCERKIKLWHVISTSLWAAVSDAGSHPSSPLDQSLREISWIYLTYLFLSLNHGQLLPLSAELY
ncbi:hypothetical protein ILYODFUR_005384 [Ilyodon furcidens]|uniref:Uncharacterized protein n=1 Tax=Ilyodon furcidens TaxID=33524 RepID=A0ABV0VE37_9TELE